MVARLSYGTLLVTNRQLPVATCLLFTLLATNVCQTQSTDRNLFPQPVWEFIKYAYLPGNVALSQSGAPPTPQELPELFRQAVYTLPGFVHSARPCTHARKIMCATGPKTHALYLLACLITHATSLISPRLCKGAKTFESLQMLNLFFEQWCATFLWSHFHGRKTVCSSGWDPHSIWHCIRIGFLLTKIHLMSARGHTVRKKPHV